MDKAGHVVYEFGGFRLDPALRILSRDGEPVIVWPKVFDTLLLLLQSQGRIVEKEELMRALWPHSFVEESNLTQNIFLLRKILSDDRNGNSFIQTVHRRGYRFVAAVRETKPSNLGTDLAANYWRGRSPFRGLRIFETEDAWLFFGREAETEELLTCLRRAPVLAVVGNSGSGKSSLMRAGLIPALEQGRISGNGTSQVQWRIAVFRPSVAPLDHLAEVLPGQLMPELGVKERAAFIRDCRNKLSAGADGLRNALAALISAIPEQAKPTRILLVADQFEELFTLTHNRQERERYIDALLAASHGDGAVVVLALRADFYADCIEHVELGRCMAANQYVVGRMAHEQLRESMEKRLQLAGAKSEAGLIDALLEDAGSEPGNLALLEHALGQLWDKCGGFGCTLTNVAYVEIGRLRGALGRHADEVYTGLTDEPQKQLAVKIFLELVHLGDGGQDTRRRVRKADLLSLGKAEEVEALLGHLASSRLISTGGDEQEQFVEVSHEALIREWPALREWLAQNREELRLERRLLQAAEEWNSLNRDPGVLLQGARLAQGEEWLGRHRQAPGLLQEFIQASVKARMEGERRELARQKAAAVRLRWFSCGLAIMLLLATGAAWFARRQQIIEKSRALAAQSEQMLLRDHGQAVDMALRSWRMAETKEASMALARALPETLVVLNHDGPVVTATFSPDGRLLVTGSYDHTAALWDATNGQRLYTLRGHTDKIQHAIFSPDGKQIVTVSDDHTAQVWSSANGHLLLTLRGHSARVWRARFSPDGRRIITASDDTTARVWSSSDGHLLTTLRGHTRTVGNARFSPDGQYIVTAGWDHTARVWSQDGSLVRILHHDTEVIDAVFSPDGRTVVTGTLGGTAQLWNSADGRLLFTLPHNGPIWDVSYSKDSQRILIASVAHSGVRIWSRANGQLLATLNQDGSATNAVFSPDGRYVLTAGSNNVAQMWNSSDGYLLASLEGHSAPIQHAEFSPDGQRVVTTSADQTVRIWNTTTAHEVVTLENHAAVVTSAIFSSNGRHVATTSLDNRVRVWSATDGRLHATLQGHIETTSALQFSPDGRRIVIVTDNHMIRVWNTADGSLVSTLKGHLDRVWSVQFSPDGQRIVSGSVDKTARVWNLNDGRLLLILQGHTGAVVSAQFSPEGEHIVTASSDHTVRVWGAGDGRLLLSLTGHTDAVVSASFSPDGDRILTTSLDGTARLWKTVDGSLITTFQGRSGSLTRAQFSPEGRRIVTASQDDDTARVWNVANGQLIASLKGHANRIGSAQFSPDGQRIVTASGDDTARVWNAADGRLIAILKGHGSAVWSAQFSPDGQRILTGSLDTTARIWELLTLDDIGRILAK